MLPGMTGCILSALSKPPPGVTLVHTSTSLSATANYGPAFPGRWIVVIGLGGDSTFTYTGTFAATISGSPATIISRTSTGDGTTHATGVAIFVGQPTGTSGTVTLSGTGTSNQGSFYVLSVSGYNMGSAFASDTSLGSGSPSPNIAIPAKGLTLGVVQNSSLGSSSIGWSTLTERIPDATLIGSHDVSVAWDFPMSASGSYAVTVGGTSTNNGWSAGTVASFSPS